MGALPGLVNIPNIEAVRACGKDGFHQDPEFAPLVSMFLGQMPGESQFGEAQAKELKIKQAQLEKAKAEPNINPNLIEVSERVIVKEKPRAPIPEIEWWDAVLLPSGTYGDINSDSIKNDKLKNGKNHNISAEREQPHIDRNIARKLTPAERREKKVKKLFDDPNTLEKIVSVYKIDDLSHLQTRYKVNVNAQENLLTGCLVITEDLTVVAVEGGNKSIKRFGQLMLERIKYKPVNKCVLVWQGCVAKSSFNGFAVHKCRTEAAAARKCFADAGVGHYWDISVDAKDDS
ncbi:hypothetical protein MKW92_025272 [Papaver armeniacum]|nr:hypothetical protein MKW92_025272 [Papaver armeniacum]